jgi:phosphoglucomutase
MSLAAGSSMPQTANVKKICDLLAARYQDGPSAARRLKQWLSGEIPFANEETIAQHLHEKHLPLLFDSFWQELPFGTGGRRGRVGYGPNRLNPATVAATVQGHCNHLRVSFPDRDDLAVVVANDVRSFKDISGVYRFLGAHHPALGTSSRSLAKLACQIYAANGIIAYLEDPQSDVAVLSTPELSFVINQLHAVGGVNLSASHNPPDDNGVKVYDRFGSQPVAPDDQLLVNAMTAVTNIQTLPFNQACEEGLIRSIPERLHQEYIDTYVRLYDAFYTPRRDAPLVYTPLCGCGMGTVGDALTRLGFPFFVPPHQHADGSFAAIPFKAPNPEVAEATSPARAFADKMGCGVVLSSDPDADRVGLEARLADGSWYHFDGNQIGAILCYLLMLDPRGPKRRGLVIATTVTTKLLRRITEASPESMIVDDLLVGFKYIANVLKTLKRTGRYANVECSSEDLVLAAEESHGIMLVPTILDKDATPACLYLAGLYQRLQQEGLTLLDYYVNILEEFGEYDTVNRSITMSGAEGVSRTAGLMVSLRHEPPSTIGGRSVSKVIDYWDQQQFGKFVSYTDQLPRNLIQYFTDEFVITVRPSGTEPKLKFYCQLLPSSGSARLSGLRLLQDVRARSDGIARLVYSELLERIDLSLSEAALWLPDIVDFDRKRDFDLRIAPQLAEALKRDRFARLDDLLSWLADQTVSMTPGADPLPALKAAVACLLREWSAQVAHAHMFDELEKWTRDGISRLDGA